MNNPTKLCQYYFKGCQKTASFQHIVKLGAVKIDQGWACGNCKRQIEKGRQK